MVAAISARLGPLCVGAGLVAHGFHLGHTTRGAVIVELRVLSAAC